MKVIQANKYFYLKGGAERYMLDLSARLKERGHEVIPFAMDHPDNLETPDRRFFPSQVHTGEAHMGWQGVRTVGRMMYSFESRRKMKQLIRQRKPDLCHLHNIYTQLSPSFLPVLKSQGVPIVMTVHDHHLISPQYNIWATGCGEDYRNVGVVKACVTKFHKDSRLASTVQTAAFKLHKLLGLYKKSVDVFICPSRYMKRQLVIGGFPEQKIEVIPYGMNVRHIEPRYDHDGYVLFVGRLSEEKGVETIIRAAKLLEDIPFKIVGRGPQSAWLHKLAHGHANIEFLGFKSGKELEELYRGAVAVLLPSRVHENFPLAALEAMSYGKPVIASDVGGVGEIVQDRQTGFLVDPVNLDGWVESILRVFHGEARKFGEQARKRIEDTYPYERHIQQIMALYSNLT